MPTTCTFLRPLINEGIGNVEQKVIEVLDNFLQNLSPDSIRVATQEIDKLNPARHLQEGCKVPDNDLEEFLWQTWDAFISVARQVPHDHPFQDRMVDLVEALTLLPPLNVEIWQTNTRLWTDLPLLGPSMREAWISPEPTEGHPTNQMAQEWINLNAFAARLLKVDAVSWTVFGIWELREALEEPSEISRLECNVPAAAEWIRLSGELLYRQAIHGTEGKEEIPSVATGSLYNGKNTMCLERWKFWKCRFGDIGEEADKHIRQVALKARREMEVIEQDYTG
ncbi:hypothetical protein EYZ11_003851 [Aspergillus tanneri]|uniref:Uncharacterized protein n=1 Tax=Aspergillus tanneri TaxID=1220188 RepID=A0A4S3JM30_9EURO|nr:uncharacterized protein ATNIH1004_005863 [Aspergillus tanneri]KAA8647173.1 hypothetical protein ATNIH1004_005863 [Aspergillus tanneri]THC96646.1 hypothetical protein EYZ11_003851 [Aspergillus tanneri]